MKDIFIILILLLYNSNSYTKDIIITLKNETCNEKLEDYCIEKVINSLNGEKCIGFLNAIKKKPIFFENEINDEVSRFYNVNSSENKELIPLIIRINNLFIYPVAYIGQVSLVANVNLSFIVHEDTTCYEVFNATVTKEESVFAENASSCTKTLTKALEKCIIQFKQRSTTNKLKRKIIYNKALYNNPLITNDYPIFEATSYEKGIYWDFYDFRDNTPDKTIPFSINYIEIEDSLLEAKLKLDSVNLKTKIKDFFIGKPDDIWGFSDEEHIFIRRADKYISLERNDSMFYIIARPKEFGSYTSNYGMHHGALGVLISSMFEHSLYDENKYILDFAYGDLNSYYESSYTKIESRLIFYSAENNTRSEYIDLYTDDKYVCRLTTNTWHQINLPSSIRQIEIKALSSNGQEVSEIIDANLFKDDIYLILDRKKKGLSISKVSKNWKDEYFKILTNKNKAVLSKIHTIE